MLKVPSLSEIRLITQLIMSNTLGVHRDKAGKNQYDDDATLARVMECHPDGSIFVSKRKDGPGARNVGINIDSFKSTVSFHEMLFACFLPCDLRLPEAHLRKCQVEISQFPC